MDDEQPSRAHTHKLIEAAWRIVSRIESRLWRLKMQRDARVEVAPQDASRS
jgi:hypothetical protein